MTLVYINIFKNMLRMCFCSYNIAFLYLGGLLARGRCLPEGVSLLGECLPGDGTSWGVPPRGCLPRGVPVWGVPVLGLAQGVSLLGGACPGGYLPGVPAQGVPAWGDVYQGVPARGVDHVTYPIMHLILPVCCLHTN